jgi:hypothetical protein
LLGELENTVHLLTREAVEVKQISLRHFRTG